MNTQQLINAERQKIEKIQKKIEDLKLKDEERLIKIARQIGLFDNGFTDSAIKKALQSVISSDGSSHQSPAPSNGAVQ